MLDLLVWIEVKPALAALIFRPAVPRQRQRLKPAVREFDEILLQRIEAEGIFHFERCELAIRPVRLDHEFPVAPKEAGMHAEIVEAGVAEIAEHRFVGSVLHRGFVL